MTDQNDQPFDIIRPCITLKTGTAAGSFVTPFCLEKALECLRSFPGLEDVRISNRLGILRTYGAFRLLLYRDGSFDLSPVQNPDEARNLLREIGKTLVNAALCPVTGDNPALCKDPCAGTCSAGPPRIALKGENHE